MNSTGTVYGAFGSASFVDAASELVSGMLPVRRTHIVPNATKLNASDRHR